MKDNDFLRLFKEAIELLATSDTLQSLQKVLTEIAIEKKKTLNEIQLTNIVIGFLQIQDPELYKKVYIWLLENIHRTIIPTLTKDELIFILETKIDISLLRYLNTYTDTVIHQVLEEIFRPLLIEPDESTKTKSSE